MAGTFHLYALQGGIVKQQKKNTDCPVSILSPLRIGTYAAGQFCFLAGGPPKILKCCVTARKHACTRVLQLLALTIKCLQ
jgi:hypothetical protein